MSKPSFAVIASLLAALFWLSPANSPRAAETESSGNTPKWEYHIEHGAGGSEDLFNKLGDDGWEMCGVATYPNGVSWIYFKRMKKAGVPAAAAQKTAQVQADVIGNACELYRIAMGSYPQSLQDLLVCPKIANASSWEGPYLDKEPPKDPWGHPYRYDAKGKRHNGQKPDIWSLGPDGLDATPDDIVNR